MRRLAKGILGRLSLLSRRITIPQHRFIDPRVTRRAIRGAMRYTVTVHGADGAAAFAINLDAVVAAAGEDRVVALATSFGEPPVVGMASRDVPRLLNELAGRSEPFYVKVTGTRGSSTLLAREAPQEVDPGDHLRIFLFLYDPASGRVYAEDHGTMVEVSEVISPSDETVEVYGTSLRPSKWPPRPAPFAVTFPIDVVFMWVDGTDQAWQERRMRRLEELDAAQPMDNALGRYRQHDELRYSLRSVHRNAPWVRKIYLVTDQQTPAWLHSHPRLRVVDHREILPESALPTFNSHAIACALHRIPGLSDRFILLNDDVFIGRPLRPDRLILGNGITKFFLSRTPLPVDPNTIHDEARGHTADLVHRMVGFRPNNVFKHTPIAFNKTLLESLAAELPEEYERTLHSPFRSPNDIVVEYLHHYVGYARRMSIPGEIDYGYFGFGSDLGMSALRRYRRSAPLEVFCVNDVRGSDDHDSTMVAEMVATLTAEFPHPSPHEKVP